MIILALETSTRQASLAVWRDGEVVREWSFCSERSHNSLLFAPLREAWAVAKPDLMVVGTGPGSYAGVRVALAAALGVSLAKNVPLLGWPSLTAHALAADGLMVGDARRGGFFLAELVGARLQGEPEIMTLEALARRLGGRSAWTFDEVPCLPEVLTIKPSAGWLARRVAALSEAERSLLAGVTPEPLYLRPPFITTPRPRIVG